MNKPNTVEEYISLAPIDVQEKLNNIRSCIRKVVPDATESLKWGMPAFSYKRILVTYAFFKHHIGFYPTPSAMKAFSKELSEYKTAAGSIQFPHDKPLPLPLIKAITEYRVKESKEEDKKWKE